MRHARLLLLILSLVFAVTPSGSLRGSSKRPSTTTQASVRGHLTLTNAGEFIATPNTKIQAHPDSGTIFKKFLEDSIFRIKEALGNDCLRSTEGQEILRVLEDPQTVHTVTIRKFDGALNDAIPTDFDNAQKPGIGSDVTVHWNPENVSPFNDEPNVSRDPEASLLHELAHASHQFQGTFTKQTGPGTFDPEEAFAVRVENAYRRGKGLKMRTIFAGLPLPAEFHPECCGPGQLACKGSCCSAPRVCTDSGCQLCPSGKTFCRGVCCDKECKNNQCVCGDLEFACGGACLPTQGCTSGVCCPGARKCCTSPEVCCAGNCCGLSDTKQPIACCQCHGVTTCSSLRTSSCPKCQ